MIISMYRQSYDFEYYRPTDMCYQWAETIGFIVTAFFPSINQVNKKEPDSGAYSCLPDCLEITYSVADLTVGYIRRDRPIAKTSKLIALMLLFVCGFYAVA